MGMFDYVTNREKAIILASLFLCVLSYLLMVYAVYRGEYVQAIFWFLLSESTHRDLKKESRKILVLLEKDDE